MIFNCKDNSDTNHIHINGENIERVWRQGKEKPFKLVGIMIDEKLNWEDHINYIAKKISYANYSINKARNWLASETKKLLYSKLIHSHLVYGAPIWGFATQNRLDKLLKQQKKAIRKIYNLQYRDHTNDYYIASRILKLPNLLKHSTMCYIQSRLHEDSPWHIYELWKIKPTRRDDLRYTGLKLQTILTKTGLLD